MVLYICGDNMKKLVYLLIVLLVLYFGLEFSFTNLSKGHNVEYKVKTNGKEFLVKEVYVQKKKHEIDNYYFEIKINESIFNFQTYNKFKKRNYIIKSIEYFKNDNYECIYPIFKNKKNVMDVLCKKNNVQYDYNIINDKEVKAFVKNIKSYDSSRFIDNTKNKIESSPVTLYNDNVIKKHYLVLENYKGIYLINKKNNIKNITIFDRDVYQNKLSSIILDNYLVANHNKDYSFHELYLYNIKSGKKKTIISDKAIPFDSYIQGSIGRNTYLFDKSNKIQYRINSKTKTVMQIGNTSKGIDVYNNNSFTTGSAYDAYQNKVTFTSYKMDNKFENVVYKKVDKVGNKLSGYYYLYKKEDNGYKVYRVCVQNRNILKYLFTTTDLDDIAYYKDYIYYKSNNKLKYYQDNIGSKTLLENSEFEFNSTLKFGLYVD